MVKVDTSRHARSKEPEEQLDPGGDSISPRHTVMVAGLEKDIVSAREFVKGGRLEKNRARQAGHLKGIHRRMRRQTGVIQVKKKGLFWKFWL